MQDDHMAQPLVDWHRLENARVTHFSVFGERRSGTNFARALLRKHTGFGYPWRRYGWKHGVPAMPVIPRSALMVVMVRDPVDWLLSMHNQPFVDRMMGLSFSDFLRTEWHDDNYQRNWFEHVRWGYLGAPKDSGVPHQLDRHPLTGKPFRDVLEMRSVKLRAFTGLLNRGCNAVVIRYEDLWRDPDHVLKAISDRFGVTLRNLPVREMKTVGPPGTSNPRLKRDEIGAEDMAYIRDHIDGELEDYLGYALPPEPAAGPDPV